MKHDLKDWLNSINYNKDNLIQDHPETIKSYTPFIVNKCVSGHLETVLFANEMNVNHHIDKDMQYSFFLYTLRKRKRFSPWLKKEQVDDLDLVKKHYGYSNEKARIAVSLLTKTQIEKIRKVHDMGGLR